MTMLNLKVAPVVLALALAATGVTLAAGAAPTLAGPIAPFGCYA